MNIFAIYGNPVAHSRSPLMHNKVFSDHGINACYTRICLEDGTMLKEDFLARNLSGANVTVPHKEAAFKACDEVRGFAQKVGVVNTIVREDDKLIGYNTDADGFVHAMHEAFDKHIHHIAVLGAGGTARALVAKFVDLGIRVTLINRSAFRFEHFKHLDIECATFKTTLNHRYDLVLNTTSAGLNDDNLPAPHALIDRLLDNTRFVGDAIYGKTTPFLALAQKKNLPTIDGKAMLIAQGVLAHALFIHNALDKDTITKSMQASFSL